jgi:hypothetical protein
MDESSMNGLSMDELSPDRALPAHIPTRGQVPYHEPKFIDYGGLAELVQHGQSAGTDFANDDASTTAS